MKYGPEITKEIADSLRSGNNRTDSCVLAGISYETFTRWMEAHAEFCEAIKKAEVQFKNECIQVIRKAAPTSWQASAWLLERKYRLEFALKEAVEPKDDDVPAKMAKRAHELLSKLEGKKPTIPGANGKVNGNGNGIHP